jgi:hypothetical protein
VARERGRLDVGKTKTVVKALDGAPSRGLPRVEIRAMSRRAAGIELNSSNERLPSGASERRFEQPEVALQNGEQQILFAAEDNGRD